MYITSSSLCTTQNWGRNTYPSFEYSPRGYASSSRFTFFFTGETGADSGELGINSLSDITITSSFLSCVLDATKKTSLRYPTQYRPFLPSSQLKLVHAAQYSMRMRKTLPIRCVNYFQFRSIPFRSVPGFIPSQSCQEQILRVTEVFLLSSAMFGCCTTVAPWYTLIVHFAALDSTEMY